MKKVRLVPALLLVLLCFSCDTEEATELQEPLSTENLVSVSLEMRGELATAQAPLKTQETTQTDLFGIQFYDSRDKPYAFVVGDHLTEITVDLPKGESFMIEATYVKQAKEKVEFWKSDDGWAPPFATDDRIGAKLNKVYYTSSNKLGLVSHVEVSTMQDKGKYDEVDRYYGRVDGFTPTEENSRLSMDLKRIVFGLKLNLELKEDEGVDTLLFSINNYANRSFEIPVSDGVGTLEIPYLTLAVPECLGCLGGLNFIEDEYQERISISIGTPDHDTRYYSGDITVKRNKMMVINHLLEEEETVGGGF